MIPSRQESYLKRGKKALDMCSVGCAESAVQQPCRGGLLLVESCAKDEAPGRNFNSCKCGTDIKSLCVPV
jgi:hypothetical protein